MRRFKHWINKLINKFSGDFIVYPGNKPFVFLVQGFLMFTWSEATLTKEKLAEQKKVYKTQSIHGRNVNDLR